ncbi:MAG: hypothetical protein ABI614_08505, partial [Planctomycetota bacterium]
MASVIWLTGDTELAFQIDPDISQEDGYRMTAVRIGEYAVATRQFGAIRDDLAHLSDQVHQNSRVACVLTAVRCALEGQDHLAATKLLDSLDAATPGLAGWRLRTLLVECRDLPLPELLERVGDVPSVEPSEDFQAAAIAEFAGAMRSK